MSSSVRALAADAAYDEVLRSAPTETGIVCNTLNGPALIQAVLRYCPPLAKLQVEGFVAGGFVRDVVAGTVPRDMDVYVRSEGTATEIETEMRLAEWVLGKVGMISTTWRDQRGHVVQLVRADGISAAECIRRFDLTICCAAVELRTSQTFCSTTFVTDLACKHLVINRPAFAVDTLRRIARFADEGYSVSSEQLQILHGCILRELHSHGISAFRPSELP